MLGSISPSSSASDISSGDSTTQRMQTIRKGIGPLVEPEFSRSLPLHRRSCMEWLAEGTAWSLPALARSQDRKSTRLNSSHVRISYAVFCLKKKKKQA